MPSLYHYTKIDIFLDYIAPSALLKTNSLRHMNDPRESVEWAFAGMNVPYESIFDGYYDESTHIKCQYELGERVKDQFQITCFSGAQSSGWDNEMMWAHYGGLHTGICLEFDESQLIASIRKNFPDLAYYVEDVDYKGAIESPWLYWNRQESYEQNMRMTIKRIYREVTLTKSHFWEKEDEKRLVVFSSDPLFIPLESSLKRLYVGMNFDSQILQSKLFGIVGQFGAELVMLVYENYKFKRWGLREDNGKIKSYDLE